MFKKIKDIIINPVCTIIFLLLIMVICKSIDAVKSVENVYSEIVDLNAISVRGYSYENNTLTPLNDDPQMNIPCSSEKVNFISIFLAEPILSDCTARVYYSVSKDQGLDETSAFDIKILAGSSKISFELPMEAVYTRIRFDLSSQFTLDKIEMLRNHDKLLLRVDYFRIALGIAVAVLMILIYIKKQQPCDVLAEKIVDFLEETGKSPIVVVLFLLLIFIGFKSVNITEITKDTYSETVNLNDVTVKGYFYENNTLIPLNNDPQINIPCSSEAVNNISIKLSEPIISNCEARVYYSVADDQVLSEETAFNVNIPVGATAVNFELPYNAVYTRIRFDLDNTFVLDNIELICRQKVLSFQINYPLLISGIVVTVVIVLLYLRHEDAVAVIINRWTSNCKRIVTNPIYIILFVLLGVIVFKSINNVTSFDTVYTEIVDLNEITVRNYSCENNTFIPLNSDPQMNIPCSSNAINIVTIRLTDPIDSTCTARVYYSFNEDRSLSETNAFNVDFHTGSTEIVFELPEEAVYTRIRLDLSSVFSLENIELHRGNLVKSLKLNYFLLIFGTIAIIAMLWIYVKNKKICDNFFAQKAAKCINNKDFVLDNSYKNNLSKLYLILAITFGILIIFLSPPNSMPDETVHFNIASSISKMNFFSDFNEDGIMGFWNSYDEVNTKQYRHITEAYTYDIAQSQYNNIEIPGLKAFFPNKAVSPIGHIVAGIGMAAARRTGLDLSAYTLMIIGRFSNLLFSAIIISLSIRKSRALNNTMFLLGLMPMTIYMCSSISYDAIVIAAVYMLFAAVNSMVLSDNSYTITTVDIVMVCISCFFLFGSKGAAYSTFVLTLLAIDRKKFGNTKKYLLCICLVAFIAILAYVFPNTICHILNANSNYVTDERIIQQEQYLITNLDQIPNIILSTFKQQGVKYWEGYIGYLGWQDIRMPYPYLLLFSLALMLSFFVEICYIEGVGLNLRILSVIALVISFLGIIFSIYISYTPIRLSVGGNVAYGVQGRYFIPLTLYAMIIFANPLLRKLKNSLMIMEVEGYMVKIAGISSCLITSFTLFTAYWV